MNVTKTEPLTHTKKLMVKRQYLIQKLHWQQRSIVEFMEARSWTSHKRSSELLLNVMVTTSWLLGDREPNRECDGLAWVATLTYGTAPGSMGLLEGEKTTWRIISLEWPTATQTPPVYTLGVWQQQSSLLQLIDSAWRLWCQMQVSRAWRSNHIPQYTVGCDYFSML